MKTIRILALMLALMMMGSIAVAENAGDPIVVKVGETEVRLAEAQKLFDEYHTMYEQQLAQYGLPMTDEYQQELATITVEILVERAAISAMLVERGLGDYAEEKAQLRADIEEYVASETATFAAQYGMTEEDAAEAVASMGFTVDSVYDSEVTSMLYSALLEDVSKDIEVTDEDVKEEYETLVAQYKASYEASPASFEEMASSYPYEQLFYVPEGFRYVKHILLAMPDDVSSEIMDLETDLRSTQNELNALNDELYALENVEEEPESEPRTPEEIQADIDVAQEKYDGIAAQIEEKRENVLPGLQSITDEIYAKLESGTSFDDLIAEYNTDPGMESNPDGYLVYADSAQYVTSFRDGAMALEKVGDVSEPVLSDYGVHIIEYASDMPAGEVELTDEVAEVIKEYVLSNKKEAHLAEVYDAWLAENEVEKHPELLVIPELLATETTTEEGAAEEAETVQRGIGTVESDEAEGEETEAPEPNKDGSVG